MAKSPKVGGKAKLAPALSAEVPDGPPKFNPLTAEDYAALMKLNENLHLLADLLPRAHNVGLEVGMDEKPQGSPAATYEMHHGVMHRILKNFPPPATDPLSL